jgi:hypothetical protein
MSRKYGPSNARTAGVAMATRVNLSYPVTIDWGATKRGRGTQKHAIHTIPLESYMTNTGSFLQDAKESGK